MVGHRQSWKDMQESYDNFEAQKRRDKKKHCNKCIHWVVLVVDAGELCPFLRSKNGEETNKIFNHLFTWCDD
jgi:hypothetical protein